MAGVIPPLCLDVGLGEKIVGQFYCTICRRALEHTRIARELARERRVLVLRFVEDLTQTQIADQIGVSQMQVSRILRRALSRLRELTQSELLEA